MGHTSFQFDRRTLLKGGLAGAGAIALGPSFYHRAFAAGPVTVGDGPYGPPGPFDANGIALPKGFRSREIARGNMPVADTGYTYHIFTDGQATFPTVNGAGRPDGGWILTANSEVPGGGGGVSGIEFAPDGKIQRAYRVLSGTTSNCAGGPTPWGTWLSCEEQDNGKVWECDPTGSSAGIARPAMGIFAHEAACVDPGNERIYLTEDKSDGCFYRFTPTDYPDLSSGLLEVAVVSGAGKVAWRQVPDPSGGSSNPTRSQVADATKFNGGEGTWFDDGVAYFTTKGDNRVWAFHVKEARLDVLYDREAVMPDPPLSGVDNITVSQSGDIYVCEDGGDLDICLITPGFEVSRFLKMDPAVHDYPAAGPIPSNEVVGVVFDPSGTRMYFGLQRTMTSGFPAGIVYEVSGPFRQRAAPFAPVTRLSVQRRIRVPKFLRLGLPVKLRLDEPVGIAATLRVSTRGRGGKRRMVKIGSTRSKVAVKGRPALSVRANRNARKVLRGRRRAKAELTIIATDGTGKRRVRRRDVVLFNPHPRHPFR